MRNICVKEDANLCRIAGLPRKPKTGREQHANSRVLGSRGEVMRPEKVRHLLKDEGIYIQVLLL